MPTVRGVAETKSNSILWFPQYDNEYQASLLGSRFKGSISGKYSPSPPEFSIMFLCPSVLLPSFPLSREPDLSLVDLVCKAGRPDGIQQTQES